MAAVTAAGEELVADDVVWHEIGRAEPLRGKAELRAGMGEIDYIIDRRDPRHPRQRRPCRPPGGPRSRPARGKTLDYRVAEIYHLKNGKITERWAFSDDTAAITAFFA